MLPETFSDKVKFRLIRPLAQGGMGEVFEAIQMGAGLFEKVVALKLIRDEHSHNEDFRNNFIGEARLVADLIHANIVQVYHLGFVDPTIYFVMEFVDGPTLETFILQHRALKSNIPPRLAAFIVSRICRGLEYAHTKPGRNCEPLNIVHRDLNPKNIIISFGGDVKITDFGIAKALDLMYNEEGEIIAGQDAYLSPEQARKEVTDSRADLFACGILLTEMLLGQNPFDTGNETSTREQILHLSDREMFRAASHLPAELIQIASRSLAKDRNSRFQSAGEMMIALEHFLYRNGYGPTNEKLAQYVGDQFRHGLAFNDSRECPAPSVKSPVRSKPVFL